MPYQHCPIAAGKQLEELHAVAQLNEGLHHEQDLTGAGMQLEEGTLPYCQLQEGLSPRQQCLTAAGTQLEEPPLAAQLHEEGSCPAGTASSLRASSLWSRTLRRSCRRSACSCSK